jgi:hypothetical protein
LAKFCIVTTQKIYKKFIELFLNWIILLKFAKILKPQNWLKNPNYIPKKILWATKLIPKHYIGINDFFPHLVYCLYSLGLKFVDPSASHMCRKSPCKQNIINLSIEVYFKTFSEFLVLNQNIHAQQCTHVENLHQNKNYFNLDSSHFFT